MLKIQEHVAPNENIQRERNFGIDLLRVIATFMVVLLHVLSKFAFYIGETIETLFKRL